MIRVRSFKILEAEDLVGGPACISIVGRTECAWNNWDSEKPENLKAQKSDNSVTWSLSLVRMVVDIVGKRKTLRQEPRYLMSKL